MLRLKKLMILLAVLFTSSQSMALNFTCSTASECNGGICVSQNCECPEGTRNAHELACAPVLPSKSYMTGFGVSIPGLFAPVALLIKNRILPPNQVFPNDKLSVPNHAAKIAFGVAVVTTLFSPLSLFIEGFNELGGLTTAGLVTSLGFNGAWNLKRDWFNDRKFLGCGSKHWVRTLSWMFYIGHIGGAIWPTFMYARPVRANHYGLMGKWYHKDEGEADLVILGSDVAKTARITLNTFDPSSCAIQEACVNGPGERRLLRFDASVSNIGKGDFLTPLEGLDGEWSECHAHYHSLKSTSYKLRNVTDNSAVVAGHKQGFCFRDNRRISGDNFAKFWCGLPRFTKQMTHGITAGWTDVYDGGLDCQWIDITGLPAGRYHLNVIINPEGVFYQDIMDNNEVVVEVLIPSVDVSLERTEEGRYVPTQVLKEYDDVTIKPYNTTFP